LWKINPMQQRGYLVRPLPALLLILSVTPALARNSKQTIPVDKFQENKIPRLGFDLYYRTAGNGPPILILSGGPGDDSDYMAPVALEAAKFGQAILLEQRGTGRSIPPAIDNTTINLATYLGDIEALRVQFNVERWTLIGHSAGGLLAMHYAAAYPDRVDKLILLDSAPIASEFLGPLQTNILDRLSPQERDRLTVLEKSSAPDAQAEMAQINAMALFFDRQIGARVAATMGNSWHAEVGRLLGNEISAPGYDLRPRLKEFERPVLVLNGRQDPMDPLMAHETSAAFKNSTLRFIDRAGHMPWFDQQKQFAYALDDFLK
jgi:proline iminopeptidase